jgi:hypothetical protein
MQARPTGESADAATGPAIFADANPIAPNKFVLRKLRRFISHRAPRFRLLRVALSGVDSLAGALACRSRHRRAFFFFVLV